MSMKDMGNGCFMCRHRAEMSQINEDMVHFLLTQAHSLETVIDA